MKHCHLCLCCNELPYLKQKLPFLYKHFSQIIIIDYDILNNCNSTDGSVEFIETYTDKDKKIILLKNFNPKHILEYYGVSIIEKQKMFAYGSKYINDDIDLLWATDLDEFFNETCIKKIETLYRDDPDLISVDQAHIGEFVYNQYNLFDFGKNFFIKPRITKHIKGKIYGHCNFETYGKTIQFTDEYLYHFSYVGFKRCYHKLKLFNKDGQPHQQDDWCRKYMKNLLNNIKYIDIRHPGHKTITSIKYSGKYPEYINIQQMVDELNYISPEEINNIYIWNLNTKFFIVTTVGVSIILGYFILLKF